MASSLSVTTSLAYHLCRAAGWAWAGQISWTHAPGPYPPYSGVPSNCRISPVTPSPTRHKSGLTPSQPCLATPSPTLPSRFCLCMWASWRAKPWSPCWCLKPTGSEDSSSAHPIPHLERAGGPMCECDPQRPSALAEPDQPAASPPHPGSPWDQHTNLSRDRAHISDSPSTP